MTDAPRTVSGKWVILAFAAVSVAMAVGGWAYFFNQQRRPMALWGTAAAKLIAKGPQTELWSLEDAGGAKGTAVDGIVETMFVDGQRLRIVARRDAAAVPGLSQIRQALMSDRCFDWDAMKPSAATPWRYALRFTEGNEQATLVFSGDGAQVRLLETGKEASTKPIAEGIAKFLQDSFPTEPPADSAATETPLPSREGPGEGETPSAAGNEK
jgi:hypothetical protein